MKLSIVVISLSATDRVISTFKSSDNDADGIPEIILPLKLNPSGRYNDSIINDEKSLSTSLTINSKLYSCPSIAELTESSKSKYGASLIGSITIFTVASSLKSPSETVNVKESVPL
jgi:hypothetical protein